MATRREATDGESTVYDETEDATTRGGTDDIFAFTDRTAVDAGLPRRAVGLPAVTGPRPAELVTPADPDEETAFDPPLVDALVAALPIDGRARIASLARADAPTQPRGVAEASLSTQPHGVAEASLSTQPLAALEASLATQPLGAVEVPVVTAPRSGTPSRGVAAWQPTQPRAMFGEEGTHSTVSQAVDIANASTQPRVTPPPAATEPTVSAPAPVGPLLSEVETRVAPPPARSLLIADFEPTHEVDSAAVRWVDLRARVDNADPARREPHVPPWLALLERFDAGADAATSPDPRAPTADRLGAAGLGAVVPPAFPPGVTDQAPIIVAERPDPRARRDGADGARKAFRDPASIEAIASLSDLPAARPRPASSARSGGATSSPPSVTPWGSPPPAGPSAPERALTPPLGATARGPASPSAAPSASRAAPPASPGAAGRMPPALSPAPLGSPGVLGSPGAARPSLGARPLPSGPAAAAALIAPVALARVDSVPSRAPEPSATPAPLGPVPSALRARPLVFSSTTPKGALAPHDTVPLAPWPAPPPMLLGTPPELHVRRVRPPPDYATIAAAVLVVIAIGLLLVVRWVAR
jgi:hypothetical protein